MYNIGAGAPLSGGTPVEDGSTTPAHSLRDLAFSQVEASNRLEVVPPVEFAPLANSRQAAVAARELDSTRAQTLELFPLSREDVAPQKKEVAPGVLQLINATSICTLGRVTNSEELLQAAMANEKVTTKTVNRLLKDLPTNEALRNHGNILRDVKTLIHQNGQITVGMLELPCEFYLEHASSEVQSLAARLKPCIWECGTKFEAAELALLSKAKVFVVVSLMKLSLSPKGLEFVRELATILSKNDHAIEFQIMKKSYPSSLLAYSSRSHMAAIVKKLTPPESFGAEDLSREIGGARVGNSQYFGPNKGCSSCLGFPVWPKTEIDLNTIEGEKVMQELLHAMSPEEAIERIALGGFSFTRGAQIFYTPAHIEVGHEFLHVMSNSLGVNAANVECSDASRSVWKDEEEKTTISGCPGVRHSENSLGSDYELPERYGHSGLTVVNLSDEKILLKTLNGLSGLFK